MFADMLDVQLFHAASPTQFTIYQSGRGKDKSLLALYARLPNTALAARQPFIFTDDRVEHVAGHGNVVATVVNFSDVSLKAIVAYVYNSNSTHRWYQPYRHAAQEATLMSIDVIGVTESSLGQFDGTPLISALVISGTQLVFSVYTPAGALVNATQLPHGARSADLRGDAVVFLVHFNAYVMVYDQTANTFVLKAFSDESDPLMVEDLVLTDDYGLRFTTKSSMHVYDRKTMAPLYTIPKVARPLQNVYSSGNLIIAHLAEDKGTLMLIQISHSTVSFLVNVTEMMASTLGDLASSAELVALKGTTIYFRGLFRTSSGGLSYGIHVVPIKVQLLCSMQEADDPVSGNDDQNEEMTVAKLLSTAPLTTSIATTTTTATTAGTTAATTVSTAKTTTSATSSPTSSTSVTSSFRSNKIKSTVTTAVVAETTVSVSRPTASISKTASQTATTQNPSSSILSSPPVSTRDPDDDYINRAQHNARDLPLLLGSIACIVGLGAAIVMAVRYRVSVRRGRIVTLFLY